MWVWVLGWELYGGFLLLQGLRGGFFVVGVVLGGSRSWSGWRSKEVGVIRGVGLKESKGIGGG